MSGEELQQFSLFAPSGLLLRVVYGCSPPILRSDWLIMNVLKYWLEGGRPLTSVRTQIRFVHHEYNELFLLFA